MITDSHAHLYWKSFDADREEVLRRARTAGVGRMVVVGTDVPTSRAALELCAGRPDLFPTAGIHPHDAEGVGEEQRAEVASHVRGVLHFERGTPLRLAPATAVHVRDVQPPDLGGRHSVVRAPSLLGHHGCSPDLM